MTSMNWSPPRAMDTTNPATLPAVKARMRNRLSSIIGSATLVSDDHECRQQQHAPKEETLDQGVRPAHGVIPVGLDAVGDGDQDGAQAHGEGDIAPPVDVTAVSLTGVSKLAIGPDRPEDPDGHVNPEHRPPVQGRQETSSHQADELAGQTSDLVGPGWPHPGRCRRPPAPAGRR